MYRSVPSFFKTVLLSIVGGLLIAVASSSKASVPDNTGAHVSHQASYVLVAPNPFKARLL